MAGLKIFAVNGGETVAPAPVNASLDLPIGSPSTQHPSSHLQLHTLEVKRLPQNGCKLAEKDSLFSIRFRV